MNKKSLETILIAIRNARDVVEVLGSENYPYTKFFDKEIGDIFYSLNAMSIKVSKKINNHNEEK